MCVAVPVPGTLYRTVHHPRVAIRAKPSTSAEIVHVLSAGEVFRVPWVRTKGQTQKQTLQERLKTVGDNQVGNGRLVGWKWL